MAELSDPDIIRETVREKYAAAARAATASTASSQAGGAARPRAPRGPRPLPEYVAAEVDFPTFDALSSLVTRHAGHVGVVSPPEAVAAVEQWLNSSGPGGTAQPS